MINREWRPLAAEKVNINWYWTAKTIATAHQKTHRKLFFLLFVFYAWWTYLRNAFFSFFVLSFWGQQRPLASSLYADAHPEANKKHGWHCQGIPKFQLLPSQLGLMFLDIVLPPSWEMHSQLNFFSIVSKSWTLNEMRVVVSQMILKIGRLAINIQDRFRLVRGLDLFLAELIRTA